MLQRKRLRQLSSPDKTYYNNAKMPEEAARKLVKALNTVIQIILT